MAVDNGFMAARAVNSSSRLLMSAGMFMCLLPDLLTMAIDLSGCVAIMAILSVSMVMVLWVVCSDIASGFTVSV